MAKTPREKSIRGIIIRKVKFRETSLILDVLSRDNGIIPMMAKGIRKENSPFLTLLDLLNELELIVYKKPDSDWYIFKNTELLKAHLYKSSYKTNIMMMAASELLLQLEISSEDSEKIYDLFIKYLDYIKKIKINAIAIFWRFVIRLFEIMGIGINLKKCILCHNSIDYYQAFYPQKNGFICKKCFRPALESLVLNLDKSSSDILLNFSEIGNILGEISITTRNIKQINRILLAHLEQHFHKRFHLKSLEMLE